MQVQGNNPYLPHIPPQALPKFVSGHFVKVTSVNLVVIYVLLNHRWQLQTTACICYVDT